MLDGLAQKRETGRGCLFIDRRKIIVVAIEVIIGRPLRGNVRIHLIPAFAAPPVLGKIFVNVFRAATLTAFHSFTFRPYPKQLSFGRVLLVQCEVRAEVRGQFFEAFLL